MSQNWLPKSAKYGETCPTKKNPSYAKSIKHLMKSGSDWRNYDQQFRSDREHNKCSWAAVRVDLQIAATLKPTNETSTNQPFRSSPSQQQTTPFGYCFDYHKPNTRCSKQHRKYKHLCARCGQQHPMFKQRSNTHTQMVAPRISNIHNRNQTTGTTGLPTRSTQKH